jgi:stage II sporulation protein R
MKRYELLTVLLLILCVWAGVARDGQEALAERISPAVLRLHILADSDKREDQAVKLEVRSLILDCLRDHLPSGSSKDETVGWIRQNRSGLEQAADELLERHGFSYRAKLTLVHDYFPSRTYAGLRFPCGYYDAVRVILGSGRGHNWWCVLYPQFCFLEGVCTDIPDESLEVLKKNINQDDLPALEDHRPDLQLFFLKLGKPEATQSPSVP